MKKFIALLPIIKDIAIILVCVLILVGSIHKRYSRGFYIALPISSQYFEVKTDIDSFDGIVSNDKDCSGDWWGCKKIPLEIRIVK